MTMIPDGTSEDYHDGIIDHHYAWGWLGDTLPPESNEAIARYDDVIQKLKAAPVVDLCRGWHTCEMCNEEDKPEFRQQARDGAHTFNGSIKIWYRGILFVSPYGVEHYMEKHWYMPSFDVIKAILYGRYHTE